MRACQLSPPRKRPWLAYVPLVLQNSFVTDETQFTHATGADYPLILFPEQPWTLTAYLKLAQGQARDWADWLNQVSDERQTVALSFLAQAGAPAGALGDQADWLALGAWLYRWFPLVAAPFLPHGYRGEPGWQRGYFQDWPEFRLGRALTPGFPAKPGYDPAADALLHSVAVDLALLVSGRAQAVRPGLRWQASSDPTGRDFFLTPDAAGPAFPLIRRTREFLVQATARPRGQKGHELRRWRAADLYRCYQRAAADAPLPEEYEAFPGSDEYREGLRYHLVPPPCSAPQPPPELVAAISAFRTAGWFQTNKLTDAELAAAANATWQAHEGEEIPLRWLRLRGAYSCWTAGGPGQKTSTPTRVQETTCTSRPCTPSSRSAVVPCGGYTRPRNSGPTQTMPRSCASG
jgi:hypothetical protein